MHVNTNVKNVTNSSGSGPTPMVGCFRRGTDNSSPTQGGGAGAGAGVGFTRCAPTTWSSNVLHGKRYSFIVMPVEHTRHKTPDTHPSSSWIRILYLTL